MFGLKHKSAFSLFQFTFLVIGLILAIFIGGLIYFAVNFQKFTDIFLAKEINSQVDDASNSLIRIFDRYELIAEQLAGNKKIIELIDNPDSNIDITYDILSAKVNFDIDESFLFFQNGKILFQNAQDTSLLADEEFNQVLRGVVDTKTARGIFVNSIFYGKPIFYLVLPVHGEKNAGMLVLGKVFNQEILKTFFSSPQRGIIIFSNKNEVAASNIDSAVFNKILTPSAVKKALAEISGDKIVTRSFKDENFTGLVSFKSVRFNTFPVGVFGFYIDTKDIFDIQNNFILSALIVILISCILAAAMFFLFQEVIISPILDLGKGFERISSGDFKVRLKENGLREIAGINSSFNKSSQKLENYYNELNEKAKELTIKIEELTHTNETIVQTKTVMFSLLEDAQAAEKKLARESSRLQAIISSMEEGIFAVNNNFKILLSNKTAKKLLGMDKKHWSGRDATQIIEMSRGKKKISAEEYSFVKAIKLGKPIIHDLEDNIYYKSGDNRIFPVAEAAAPVYEDDKIIGAVVVFRDITDIKKLDESKSSFISIASHQLRTPLTSMRWFSEMLIQGDAGKINNEQKRFVERIYQGTDRMINLVNLLLQIARVEAGRVKVEPTPTDLKSLAKGVVIALKSQFDAKAQTIEITTNPDPCPAVNLDQDIVWQVIQNILSNASRYSSAKSSICLLIEQKDDFIQVSVKDKGVGIPKEQQDRIFEKFFRASNALSLVPEGSGLGLSLAKSLVDGWGGKIWFKTEEGKGTTFYFTIPLKGMEPKEGEVKITV